MLVISPQSINLITLNTIDSSVVEQTTQVSATTIPDRLIRCQFIALKDNPAATVSIPLLITTDLVKITDTGRELLESSKHRTNITMIKTELLTKIQGVARSVSKSRQARIIKINITQEEIKEYQGDVKAFVGLNVSNSRILLSANNK